VRYRWPGRRSAGRRNGSASVVHVVPALDEDNSASGHRLVARSWHGCVVDEGRVFRTPWHSEWTYR